MHTLLCVSTAWCARVWDCTAVYMHCWGERDSVRVRALQCILSLALMYIYTCLYTLQEYVYAIIITIVCDIVLRQLEHGRGEARTIPERPLRLRWTMCGKHMILYEC